MVWLVDREGRTIGWRSEASSLPHCLQRCDSGNLPSGNTYPSMRETAQCEDQESTVILTCMLPVV